MSVLILEASPEVKRTVRVTICRQMAQALMDAKVDLSDDDAVLDALLDAGFGEASLKALWLDAQKLARAFSIPTAGSA